MNHSKQRTKPTTLAIAVNYHAAEICLDAVSSLVAAESVGPCTVAVVDNSADERQADMLACGLPEGVISIVHPENRGFAAACNHALGRVPNVDWVFLLNPDAVIDPDCLIRLQRGLLADRRIAAIGPQIYWDPARRYFLPPSLPYEMMEAQRALSAYPSLKRWLSSLWRRYAVRVWKSRIPVRVFNLSGGHVLIRTDALQRVGGLFDERFFLYYEDSDLFLRLRRAGYRLMVEPKAVVVHGFDRCAPHERDRKRLWMAQSAAQFRTKHGRHAGFGLLRRDGSLRSPILAWARAADRLTGAWLGPTRERSEPLMKRFMGAFDMNVPSALSSEWLFEWSPNEDFIPAAGRFGSGDRVDFSTADFDLLPPGEYVARIGRSGAWHPVAEWIRIVKGGNGEACADANHPQG